VSRSKKILVVLLLVGVALTSMAYAQVPAGPPKPPSIIDLLGQMMPMFAVVFLVFYVMVLRPQQAKLREHQRLLGSLKRGEAVVTTGGLIGRVAGIEKDHILIEFATGVKVKVEPAHVAKKQEKEAENKSAA